MRYKGQTAQTPWYMNKKSHTGVVDVVNASSASFLHLLTLSKPNPHSHKHPLHLPTVRLIRSPALPTRLERRCSLQLVSLLAERRTADALVRVGRLFDNHLLVPTLAGAAAYAEQPEEAGSNAESDAEPHDLQHLVAHRGLDVVRLQRGVEDTGEDAVDTGSGCSGCDGEER